MLDGGYKVVSVCCGSFASGDGCCLSACPRQTANMHPCIHPPECSPGHCSWEAVYRWCPKQTVSMECIADMPGADREPNATTAAAASCTKADST